MDYLKYSIEANDSSSVFTEIQYAVAAAKTASAELLILQVNSKNGQTVQSVLKKIKKSRKITLYVCFSDLQNENTESDYLLNKYPNIVSLGLADADAYIVKI